MFDQDVSLKYLIKIFEGLSDSPLSESLKTPLLGSQIKKALFVNFFLGNRRQSRPAPNPSV